MIPIAKPLIGENEKQLVNEVLNSGMLAQGSKVKLLEEKFASLCNVKYAVAVNSGTAAIHAALNACGVGLGDEVITTPFTFIATASPILMLGAIPVFVDIDENTFNIDPKKIEEKITEKTKVIMPVSLFGQPYDYKPIKEIADKHNLKIVEDACQSVNASFDGIKSGALGDISAFSLYATKNMTCGEGGMVTTNNADYADNLKKFRHHGQSEEARYNYHSLGYNYRMSDLHAAIALAQIGRIEEFTEKRIENAKMFTEKLKNIKEITTPYVVPNVKHVFHQYTIKTDHRDKIIEAFKKKGIGFGIFYPKPLHLFPLFSKFRYKERDFPVAEKIANQVLSLPVHPGVSKENIDEIVSTIEEVFKC
ncbi:MAG: DegT/DnrJ/EryC1/StrS family aminotransferase [Nanoarchaeota archaeon]|nr:DegT/DnrJ/EryC1/StrS family aminotransferase [Nanoarchaeota archaeon]MBU4124203.1 DegT/DnrJ/EryC1/StrS family aminotransferase [Nanoarchaeota archaeon]